MGFYDTPYLAVPRPNMQLPDLEDPTMALISVGGSPVAMARNPVSAVEERGRSGGHSGDVVVPRVQVSHESVQISVTDPRMCHDVCFAGLGGEVVCHLCR